MSRRETGECQVLDGDTPRLFVEYPTQKEETSDASTNQLLQRFDVAAAAGLRAFEDIAKLSRRLVRINVALMSERGMLLDILEPLSLEYNCLMAAVLTAHASCAHDLLKRRALLQVRRRQSSLVPIVHTDWERALAEMKVHVDAIQARWPETMEVLRIQLESLCHPPLLSWLFWTCSKNTKSDIHKLTNGLGSIMETAIRGVVELMRAYTEMDLAFQETRESPSANDLHIMGLTLRELIRLDTAFIRYRAGFWIMSRLAVERYSSEDLKNSPLRQLLLAESDYLFEHSPRPENIRWMKHYKY
ncbi:hypothetical protein FB45DRAFT_1066180 [Roridomyces roridus]|uniref:Uncharacterized protein n=1 Tax=Roridomyces roridus TaxID=1738132 RepID=A0AAD7F9C8_9AGAR|nr:hypothetical protein FB45DRAFT_1066180 [Roridomyces roridus]